jgi:hypothetical protein
MPPAAARKVTVQAMLIDSRAGKVVKAKEELESLKAKVNVDNRKGMAGQECLS